MTFDDYEDRTKRRVTPVTGVIVYTRFYNVPVPAAADLVPLAGTLMLGETAGVLAARVKGVTYGQPDGKGHVEVRVVYWKPVARTT